MSDSIFLKAFQGTNKRVPVWFMRQAGRYLPAYQDIRKKHSLNEMFNDPEIASQVTCQPIGLLNVDAAILFADILTLPSEMGFKIHFDPQQGPVIENPITTISDLKQIHRCDDLSNIEKTIKLTLPRLPKDVPLVGFAGAPFTVACYLLEGRSTDGFHKTLQFAQAQPKAFAKLMSLLTVNTITYLKMQKKAGVNAFQLFDTWGGILPHQEFKQWNLPCVKEIFDAIALPSIYYLKNSAHVTDLMVKSGADVLSVCEKINLAKTPALQKSQKGVQGNLHNELLYADYDVLEKEILKLLETAKKYYRKYIFNLSHGVLPDMQMEKLRFAAQVVHGFKWDE